MKNLLFVRIPSTCICFTLIVLANILLNLLYGAEVSPFIPALFGWIVVCQVIDWLISFLNFKSWLQYCLTESVILYAGSLLVAYVFDWISFGPDSLLSFTVIFLIADIFIFWYFRRRQILLAREINELL